MTDWTRGRRFGGPWRLEDGIVTWAANQATGTARRRWLRPLADGVTWIVGPTITEPVHIPEGYR